MTEKLGAVRALRALTDTAIVGVSGGKDSVAVCELLHQHGIRLLGYFCYIVPGISFQDRYLAYLSRRYGMPILRLPHPDLALFLNEGRYCAKHDDVALIGHRDVWERARQHYGVRWLATGEKKVDSLERRAQISAWGAVQPPRGRAFPIAEWSQREAFTFIKRHRVQLAPDYAMFGSSLANPLDARFLEPIRDRYPQDYDRILEAFPFAGAILGG